MNEGVIAAMKYAEECGNEVPVKVIAEAVADSVAPGARYDVGDKKRWETAKKAVVMALGIIGRE